MKNNRLQDNTEIHYAISIDNNIITKPTPFRQLAEQQILTLTKQQQSEAVIVCVTADGKQLLLG